MSDNPERPQFELGRRRTLKEALEIEQQSHDEFLAKLAEKAAKEADYWARRDGTYEREQLERALSSVRDWSQQILNIAIHIRDNNDAESIHKIVAQSRQVLIEIDSALGNTPPAAN